MLSYKCFLILPSLYYGNPKWYFSSYIYLNNIKSALLFLFLYTYNLPNITDGFYITKREHSSSFSNILYYIASLIASIHLQYHPVLYNNIILESIDFLLADFPNDYILRLFLYFFFHPSIFWL